MQEESQLHSTNSKIQLKADIGQAKQENGTPDKKKISFFCTLILNELCFPNTHRDLDLVSKMSLKITVLAISSQLASTFL